MKTQQILDSFKEILTIPRESGHEEQIIAYLQKSVNIFINLLAF